MCVLDGKYIGALFLSKLNGPLTRKDLKRKEKKKEKKRENDKTNEQKKKKKKIKIRINKGRNLYLLSFIVDAKFSL